MEQGRGKKILAVDGSARALVLVRAPLLKAAVDSGHTVWAIAARDANMQDIQVGDLEDRFQSQGIRFRDWKLDRQGMNPWSDLLAFLQLLRMLRELRPDTVLSYSMKSCIYGSLAARLCRVPETYSVITGLGYLFSGENGRTSIAQVAGRMLMRLSLSGNRKVFFQNPDDRDHFMKLGILKNSDKAVIVNGSGIDTDYFSKAPIPNGPLTFLMVARVQIHKGVREYVEAARILKNRYPSARFQLLGPFDDHPSAVSRGEIREWQKEGVVEILGGTSDVHPYYAGCHVFVLPSYREGTPRSTLEAMSTGRPVVTTDVPGCRETVEDGRNGFLVEVKNPVDLAAGMEKFIRSPSLVPWMGERSRKIAEEKYDVRKVVAVMMEAMGL